MYDIETDDAARPRRQRPKDSFQNELQSKLKERRSMGLSAEITDSDEDGFNTFHNYKSKPSKEQRPGSAKRRENHSPDLSTGLGTTTLRTKDLKKLLSNENYDDDDDDDDDEVAKTFEKNRSLGSWQSTGAKTPSPKHESKFLKKSTKNTNNALDSKIGKRTPINETLSKEDIIFGQKLQPDGKKFPQDRLQKDTNWQPPSFRSASPGSTVNYNRDSGSHGATPVDSLLESISETPREKMTPRIQRGQKVEVSPRQSSLDGNKPIPQARSKTSPTYLKESDRFENEKDSLMKRSTTPTYDIEKKRTTPTFESEKKRFSPTFDSERKRTTPTFDSEKKRTTPTFDSEKKRTTPTFDSEKKRTTPTFDSEKKRTTPTFDSEKKRTSSTFDSEKKRTSPSFDSEKKRTTPTFDSEKRRTSSKFDSEKKKTSPSFDSEKKKTTPTFDSEKKRTSSTFDSEKKRTTTSFDSEKKRTSPSFDSEKKRFSPIFDSEKKKSTLTDDFKSDLKRSSPAVDLFGRSRADSKLELDSYILSDKGQKKDSRTQSSDRQKYNRTPSPESKSLYSKTKNTEKSNEKSSSNRVTFEGKSIKSGQLEKKSSSKKSFDEEEQESQSKKTPSLMELVTDKPKPQARDKKINSAEQNDDGIRKMFDPLGGRKSPSSALRKSSEGLRKSASEQSIQAESTPKEYQQQKSEDTSSLCEELPPDPNKKWNQMKNEKDKHGTERSKNDIFIESVAGAQTMTFVGQTTKRIRPVSARSKVEHRPKPRYGLLPGQMNTMKEKQFNSTGDIREAIYEEWYREHLKIARQKQKLEEKKLKEEEEKKKKEAEEKRINAEATFNKWNEVKTKKLLTEKEKKEKEERKKKEKEEREKEEKKMESLKSFESWKEKKELVMKKALRKEAEKKKIQEEEEKEKQEKEKREKISAHSGWEKRKREEEKKKQKEANSAKKSDEEKRLEEKEALRKKEEQANENYLKWLEEKEKRTNREKQKTRQKSLTGEEDFKPAWFPSSRTIPFGR